MPAICVRLGIAVTLLGLLTTLAEGAKPAEERARREALQAQTDRVAKVLRGESLGSTLDRSRSLDALLSEDHVSDAARWQAGYVRQGDRWVQYNKIDFPSQYEAVRQEYVEQRGKFWGNDEEHLALARWCAEKGLADQARAHLMTVLLNHPDHPDLRRLLGYQRVGGEWMNAADYAAAERAFAALQTNLQTWGPEVIRIREGLMSGNPLRTQQAKTALSKLTSVDAVSALDAYLLPYNELCARECIDQLAQIEHRESTLSLCRAALYCPWREIAERAVTELKRRPLDDYVPALLAGARTNHSVAMQLYWQDPLVSRRGFMTLVDVSATSESFTEVNQRVHRIGLQFIPIPRFPAAVLNIPRVFSRAGTFNGFDSHFQREILQETSFVEIVNFRVTTLDSARGMLRGLEAQEEIDLDYNNRVALLISRMTPGNEFSSIDDLWSWWNQSMELGIDRDSKIQRSQVVEVAEDTLAFVIGSCFTADTPVWSEYGPRPIASLRVGDRVLSKDVESGELTYRSIVRTTYRETERPLTRLTLAGEPITATGGHLFWVSGTGWVRARDLKPGQLVHTVTGTVRVDAVEEVPTEPTFNLVVDGFHTYFVGDGKALCHDVSLASPTDAVVPGLIER